MVRSPDSNEIERRRSEATIAKPSERVSKPIEGSSLVNKKRA